MKNNPTIYNGNDFVWIKTEEQLTPKWEESDIHKNKNHFNSNLAVIQAMFHGFYTNPQLLS